MVKPGVLKVVLRVSLALLLMALLVVSGCDKTSTPKGPDTTGHTAPSEQSSPGNQTPALKDPAINPLTGLQVEKANLSRMPLAIMVENSPAARPQSGLQQADIIYEAVAEDMEELIETVVNIALAEEDADLASEVSVVLVDDPYIHKMNLEYRGIDRPTDVLSFAMLEEDEDEPEILGEADPEPMLGDIIISLETALRQAEEYNHSVQREVAFLTLHGLLHLLGYDHMEEAETQEMRTREEAILALLDLSR